MRRQLDNLMVWNGIVNAQISGGDVYVQKLLDLSDRECDVYAPERAFDMLSKLPECSHRVDNIYARMTWTQILLYIKRTIQVSISIIIYRRKYKLAIASSPFFHDLIPCIFSRSSNRVVIFFHLIPERKSTDWRTTIRFWIAKTEQMFSIFLIKHFFSIVIAGNELVVEQLKKQGLTLKYIISDAGIDTRKIDAVSNKEKKKDSILFMGRLTTQKGILDLVDIIAEVIKLGGKKKLTIIGDGPHRHLLEEKISQSGLGDSIELVGFISDEQKYLLLAESECFIFPSYEEGWGIALAEALYARCKCITYELEHYRSIFLDFPHYSKIGSPAEMAQLVMEDDNFKIEEQKVFIARYDYQEVISRVIINLENIIDV